MSLTSYRAAPPRVDSCARESLMFIGRIFALGRPGSDLLSRVLRHSTIGAEGFHGRVRNGIGCSPLATATRSSKRKEGLKVPGTKRALRERRPSADVDRCTERMKSSRSSY